MTRMRQGEAGTEEDDEGEEVTEEGKDDEDTGRGRG